MERLTGRNSDGGAFYKNCFREDKCAGIGCSEKCDHCKHSYNACEKLAVYEDAEQQGLLQKLPCKIGADVYTIPSKVNFELNVLSGHKENNRIYHQKIANIIFTEKGWYMTGNLDMEYGTGRHFLDIFYKETWFLTKEAAEAALKEMEK